MKKGLVSLLLVGVLSAPSTLVLAEGIGVATDNYKVTTIDNGDGTFEKIITFDNGEIIVQLVDADGFVIEPKQDDPKPEPKPDPILKEDLPQSWDDERIVVKELYGSTTSVIPFEVVEVPTSELFEGEEELEVEGVDGVLTTTIQTAFYNDNPATWLVDGGIREVTEVTKEPINKVVNVGTAVKGEEKDTKRLEIPFEIKVVENDKLPIGEEKVKTEGVNGWYELTTIYQTKDGKRTEVIVKEEFESDRKEPVHKVIEKGTMKVEDQYVLTVVLSDKDAKPIAGETLSIVVDGETVTLTTDEIGVVTFSVPNGDYVISYGEVEKEVTVEDSDISVDFVVDRKVTPTPTPNPTPNPDPTPNPVPNPTPIVDNDQNIVRVERNDSVEQALLPETGEYEMDYLPETGEAAQFATYGASMLSGLGGLALIFKKRKNKK